MGNVRVSPANSGPRQPEVEDYHMELRECRLRSLQRQDVEPEKRAGGLENKTFELGRPSFGLTL